MSSLALSHGELVSLRRQLTANEGQTIVITGENTHLLHRLLDHAIPSGEHPWTILDHAPGFGNFTSPTTPGIVDLPNEILAMVIGFLYARDLESFVLVNRHVYCQSTTALKNNRRLKAKYATIENLQSPDDDTLEFGSLANLAIRLFEKPHIGLYIEKLRAIDWYETWPGSGVTGALDHNDFPNYPLGHLAEVRASLYGLERPMTDSESMHWAGDGNEECALGMILLQAPNLKTLELDITDKGCLDILKVLRQALNRLTCSAFSKLNTLILSNTVDEPDPLPILVLKRFLQLPSLRSVHLCGYFGNPELENPIQVGKELFNVTSLSIQYSHFKTRTLHPILSCMRLKHFSYVLEKMAIDTEVDPCFILRGLRLRSKETLISLEILGYLDTKWSHAFPVGYSLGPLTDFIVLEKVTLNLGLVAHNLAPRVVSLDSILPASIQKATFHVDREWGRGQYRENIRRMFQNGHQALPRLRALRFRGSFANSTEFQSAVEGPLIHGILYWGGNVSFDYHIDR